MDVSGVLIEAYGRVPASVRATLEGLGDDQLTHRPTPDANSIAWLVWHLSRVQDDHVADAFGSAQVYVAQGFAQRFAEHFAHPVDDIGYGHTSAQVGAVRAPAALLGSYLDAVHARTVELLADVTEADLERVVDERWDPPVTLGVRLVSVLHDDMEHAGQAAYLRGML